MKTAPANRQSSRHLNKQTKSKALNPALLAFIAALLLLGSPAQAANLLLNPSFAQNSGHVVPVSWTRYEPPTAAHFGVPPLGNFWIEANVPPHSGPFYFKEWGACYNNTNNVAGIYQGLSC